MNTLARLWVGRVAIEVRGDKTRPVEHAAVDAGLRDAEWFAPIFARTRTFHRPTAPVAYDCVKVIVVRDGSVVLYSEFGQRPVTVGDAVLLGPNVLCGATPEGHVTVTTIYADTDYLIDQVFWQHVDLLHDRLDAQRLAETMYVEPAQVLHLGEDRAGLLMPWLDELVRLSVNGQYVQRFNRVQALWFCLADVITPFVKVSSVRLSPTQRARTRPTLPRHRRFTPIRAEAEQAREVLRERFAEQWSMEALADVVHLSSRHLARVFVRAYGKTPMTYLTMVRVEQMSRLLRDGDLSVAESSRAVGWRSRSAASVAFKVRTGITPSQYRLIAWDQ